MVDVTKSVALDASHTGLTTRLRPICDRKHLESWTSRRKNVRLVTEVVGERQGKISRSKVVIMFKTSKIPVSPSLRPGYDLSATEKCWNRRKNVRLVAEVVGDRQGKISRNKVDDSKS